VLVVRGEAKTEAFEGFVLGTFHGSLRTPVPHTFRLGVALTTNLPGRLGGVRGSPP